MPTYQHNCQACNTEFEDFYSMSDPIPDKCPNCYTEGKVKRLISGGSGMGIVKLSGKDIVTKMQNETKTMVQQAKVNENYKANLIGEERYQQQIEAKKELRENLKQL